MSKLFAKVLSRRHLVDKKLRPYFWVALNVIIIFSALDESDKTSSHGWSNSNRFGIDVQQGSPQLHQQQYKQQQQQQQQQQKQFQQAQNQRLLQQQQRQRQQQQQAQLQQQQQQQQIQMHQQQQQQQNQQQQQQNWTRTGSELNIYNHLINQNNRGDVPDALVEE